MHLRPLGHLSEAPALIAERRRAGRTRRPIAIGGNSAERVGVEPTVPLRVHLISNQAPSAARSSLRGGMWQGCAPLSTPAASIVPARRTTLTRPARASAAALDGPRLRPAPRPAVPSRTAETSGSPAR